MSEKDDMWPVAKCYTESEDSRTEEKKTATTMTVETRDLPSIAGIISLSDYSSLLRLNRVSAWVLRFAHNCRTKGKHVPYREGNLTRVELVRAEEEWIKAAQVRLKAQENFKQLESKFGLTEIEGVLRCVGRLTNADLEPEARTPVILPNDHELTRMIIRECHERVHHCGTRATLTELRTRYWVPKGRQTVKRIVNSCVTCKRWQGPAYSAPKVAPLPEFRVREVPAFSKVGIDFAGPLNVKVSGEGTRKVYIAIFSCCVTRALHLELVHDLSAETFQRALRRFSARRGTPSLIVSDNAKTFKATEKALEKIQNHPEFRANLDNLKIEWKFNLERAPWWGGFFERMVGSVKRCLRKVLGNARLTSDELLTVLVEIEATLNSLTYEYDELDEEALTPSHLIFGRRIKSMPYEPIEEEMEGEDSCSRRFRFLSLRLAHFWKRWRTEYLAGLREYHRNSVGIEKRVIGVGDVVTVHEDNVKRGSWKTAVVESLVEGKDNVVRGARIRVITNGKPIRMARPVQKLYPLEIRNETEQARETQWVGTHEGQEPEQEVAKVTKSGRNVPRRTAAIDAEWRTKRMLDL